MSQELPRYLLCSDSLRKPIRLPVSSNDVMILGRQHLEDKDPQVSPIHLIVQTGDRYNKWNFEFVGSNLGKVWRKPTQKRPGSLVRFDRVLLGEGCMFTFVGDSHKFIIRRSPDPWSVSRPFDSPPLQVGDRIFFMEGVTLHKKYEVTRVGPFRAYTKFPLGTRECACPVCHVRGTDSACKSLSMFSSDCRPDFPCVTSFAHPDVLYGYSDPTVRSEATTAGGAPQPLKVGHRFSVQQKNDLFPFPFAKIRFYIWTGTFGWDAHPVVLRRVSLTTDHSNVFGIGVFVPGVNRRVHIFVENRFSRSLGTACARKQTSMVSYIVEQTSAAKSFVNMSKCTMTDVLPAHWSQSTHSKFPLKVRKMVKLLYLIRSRVPVWNFCGPDIMRYIIRYVVFDPLLLDGLRRGAQVLEVSLGINARMMQPQIDADVTADLLVFSRFQKLRAASELIEVLTMRQHVYRNRWLSDPNSMDVRVFYADPCKHCHKLSGYKIPPLCPVEIEVLAHPIGHCSHRSIQSLIASECRSRMPAEGSSPLACSLYPHQLQSLAWMEAQERGGPAPSATDLHCHWREFRLQSGWSIYQNILLPQVWTLDHMKALPDTRGGILADEMGLGKTVTTLALCCRRGGTSLVVVPPNIVDQWLEMAGRHAPRLRVYVYRGVGAPRRHICPESDSGPTDHFPLKRHRVENRCTDPEYHRSRMDALRAFEESDLVIVSSDVVREELVGNFLETMPACHVRKADLHVRTHDMCVFARCYKTCARGKCVCESHANPRYHSNFVQHQFIEHLPHSPLVCRMWDRLVIDESQEIRQEPAPANIVMYADPLMVGVPFMVSLQPLSSTFRREIFQECVSVFGRLPRRYTWFLSGTPANNRENLHKYMYMLGQTRSQCRRPLRGASNLSDVELVRPEFEFPEVPKAPPDGALSIPVEANSVIKYRNKIWCVYAVYPDGVYLGNSTRSTLFVPGAPRLDCTVLVGGQKPRPPGYVLNMVLMGRRTLFCSRLFASILDLESPLAARFLETHCLRHSKEEVNRQIHLPEVREAVYTLDLSKEDRQKYSDAFAISKRKVRQCITSHFGALRSNRALLQRSILTISEDAFQSFYNLRKVPMKGFCSQVAEKINGMADRRCVVFVQGNSNARTLLGHIDSSVLLREGLAEFQQGLRRHLIIAISCPGDSARLTAGLDLSGADTVVIVGGMLDADTREQAISRVHRIGQTKPVELHEFLAKNTMHGDIHKCSRRKKFGGICRKGLTSALSAYIVKLFDMQAKCVTEHQKAIKTVRKIKIKRILKKKKKNINKVN